jgi:hypothetical protein
MVLVAVVAMVCVLLIVTVSVDVTISVNVAIPVSYVALVNVAFPPSGLGCPQIPPVHTSGPLHTLLEQHSWPAAPQGTQLPEEQMLLPRQVLLAQQM